VLQAQGHLSMRSHPIAIDGQELERMWDVEELLERWWPEIQPRPPQLSWLIFPLAHDAVPAFGGTLPIAVRLRGQPVNDRAMPSWESFQSLARSDQPPASRPPTRVESISAVESEWPPAGCDGCF
jgi:hypothetical protein